MTDRDNPVPGGEILLYQTEDGKTRLEVQVQGETVWLSQAQMSGLFQTTRGGPKKSDSGLSEDSALICGASRINRSKADETTPPQSRTGL